MTTTKVLRNSTSKTYADTEPDFAYPFTVSTIVKTMLEIIKIKMRNTVDEDTKIQFPVIAKEIILLAEQVQ